jgi:uncharacterized membrane protein YdbT with pleckstrin-like domain
MSYLDKNMMPDEKIIFRTRKHLIIFLMPGVLLLFTLFFLTNNTITSGIYEGIHGIFHGTSLDALFSRLPFIVIGLVTIVIGLKQWIIYQTSEYIITNKRVIMREGFFDKTVCDTRLSAISHITIDQDLLGQALNYGTIAINSFGGNRDFFTQVADPYSLQKYVQSQLDQTTK